MAASPAGVQDGAQGSAAMSFCRGYPLDIALMIDVAHVPGEAHGGCGENA